MSRYKRKTKVASKTKRNIESRRNALTNEYSTMVPLFRVNKIKKKNCATHKMTKTLGLASFSFVLLNLPYSIMWFVYFSAIEFYEIEKTTADYLFACVQLTEIVYILNYSINFYLYCLSSTLFRKQLFSSNNNLVVI